MLTIGQILTRYKSELTEDRIDDIYKDILSKSSTIGARIDISKLTEILIKADIDPLKYLTKIYSGMYNEIDIKNLYIPDNITKIEFNAFRLNSNIQHIILPETIGYIPDGCFLWCEKLIYIYLPNSISTIGKCAFRGCESLPRIDLPASITQIGDDAFSQCHNLKEIRYAGTESSLRDIKLAGNSVFRGIPEDAVIKTIDDKLITVDDLYKK